MEIEKRKKNKNKRDCYIWKKRAALKLWSSFRLVLSKVQFTSADLIREYLNLLLSCYGRLLLLCWQEILAAAEYLQQHHSPAP